MPKADCDLWIANPFDPTDIIRYPAGAELPEGALPAGHRSLIVEKKPAKKKTTKKK